MWRKKLANIQPLEGISNLPSYAFQFVFKNLGPFKAVFSWLTLAGVASATFKFLMVYFLSRIINEIATLSLRDIFMWFLPAWLVAALVSEFCDYFIRKYGEALPLVFSEYTRFRFYLSFLNLRSHRALNVSKEKILNLAAKYSSHLEGFLSEWVWGMPLRITRFFIILIILYYQDLTVLAVNLLYLFLFLPISFAISSRFAKIAKAYSQQNLLSANVQASFLLNLNTLKRLGVKTFFEKTCKSYIAESWDKFAEVRAFHAKRWLLQRNLFNLIYIASLAYALYQIKTGELSLGFLILLKWAFDELWAILVFLIEYYVSLVQQKQDSILINEELRKVQESDEHEPALYLPAANWQQVELRDVKARFPATLRNAVEPQVSIPSLTIKRGDKIGVIGKSGVGKSTLLNVLMSLVEFDGSVAIDEVEIQDRQLPHNFITIINSSDPLFKLSLRENILLGREVNDDKFIEVTKGVAVSTFADNYDYKVGEADFNVSGGQEQRIRLARGLLQDCEIYLLDEPFNGIDPTVKKEIIKFLKGYLQHKTVLLVTHNAADLELVDRVFSLSEKGLEITSQS